MEWRRGLACAAAGGPGSVHISQPYAQGLGDLIVRGDDIAIQAEICDQEAINELVLGSTRAEKHSTPYYTSTSFPAQRSIRPFNSPARVSTSRSTRLCSTTLRARVRIPRHPGQAPYRLNCPLWLRCAHPPRSHPPPPPLQSSLPAYPGFRAHGM